MAQLDAQTTADAVAELLEYIGEHDLPEPWIVSRVEIRPDRDNPGGWSVRAFGAPASKSETREFHYAVYITADGSTVMDAA